VSHPGRATGRCDRAVQRWQRPELAAGLGADRFLLEVRITARLRHAHILPLLDSGVEEAPSLVDSCVARP
jgi:hypothetical protein